MTKALEIKQIDVNVGQVPGLPKNPRTITGPKFENLKRSITTFPEMLEYREVLVYPHEGRFVAIGGNMRLEACRALGHKEIPVKVLPADFPIERLRELAIKDNADAYGENDWDVLANEWSDLPLEDWGMQLPQMEEFAPNLEPVADTRKISADDIVKTKEQLESQYAESRHEYAEVICPHCLETFYLNQN